MQKQGTPGVTHSRGAGLAAFRGHPVPGPWKRRSQAVRERKTGVL